MEEGEERHQSSRATSSRLQLESHRSCTIPLKELVGLLAELHRKEEEEEEKVEGRVEVEATVVGLQQNQQLIGESSTSPSTRSGKQQQQQQQLHTNPENFMGREIFFSATGVGRQNDADQEVSESSKYVWYACYGSNVWKPRFLCYIQGGQVIIRSMLPSSLNRNLVLIILRKVSTTMYVSTGSRRCMRARMRNKTK